MIRHLGVTFALLERGEKPQLSPGHGASFIKNHSRISVLAGVQQIGGAVKQPSIDAGSFHFCPFLLAF
jgi:hypothetical protein